MSAVAAFVSRCALTTASLRRGGLALLAALFVAALALRPQLVGAGPLIPEISDDLAVSHAVAGLLGTIPVLCMGLFAPAAAPLASRMGLRGVITVCIAAVAVFGLQSLVYYGFTAWMPDAFQERGWSPAAAGALLAVMGASTMVGGLGVPWLADRGGTRRAWLLGSAALAVASTFGLAALPGAGFVWAAGTGVAVGALFPLCLTMFLAGYLIAAVAPFGLGAVRDLTGSFATSLWALFATALLLLAACAPLSPARLRPV